MLALTVQIGFDGVCVQDEHVQETDRQAHSQAASPRTSDAAARLDQQHVNAEQVRVCGSVTGCIRAHEVVLTASARVVGDVHHDVLSMEAGALLEGHCRHREAAAAHPGASTMSSNEPVRLAPVKPVETASVALAARPPLAVGVGAKPN